MENWKMLDWFLGGHAANTHVARLNMSHNIPMTLPKTKIGDRMGRLNRKDNNRELFTHKAK